MAELRAFVALSRSATMNEAAAVIGRDATVLSRRLQSLEARLGVRLVQRNTRKVALTDEGRSYLARVEALVGAIDLADAEIGERAGSAMSGRIRMTAPSSFGRAWLTPALLAFRKRHPGVTLHVDYSDRSVDLVGEGYDLAIRIGAMTTSGLVARRIANRRRMICVARDHPAVLDVAEPADLAKHAALCFTGRERQQWSFQDQAGATCSVTVRCALSSNSADLLIEAACEGLGVLNTTDWHAHKALQDGRLVRILDAWRQVDAGAIHLVMPAGDPPARVRVLADGIVERLTLARGADRD